jgi:archaellum biogenesis ATPase FlaH
MEFAEETKEAYNRIVSAFQKLDLSGVTILTGNNGSGKSLIRKQLPFKLKTHYNLEDVKATSGMVKSTSMDLRTSSNPDWGGLSGIMRDTEWIATSQNTLHSIQGLIKSVEVGSGKTKYLVIDEYEIGCSEETIVAIARYISDSIKKLISEGKILGAMIITHSRTGIKEIEWEHFINLEGLTYEEWVDRKIIPTDLEKLEKNELFFYIRDNKD